jgi:dCMP deaminase
MNWDEYMHELVKVIAMKSKDPSTKVGCVITTKDHQILATGFNGFPRGVDESIAARWERPLKYDLIVHAESNAVNHAARHGVSLRGSTAYLNWYPCKECTKALIQAGVNEIVVDAIPRDTQDDWGFHISRLMLEEAGVKVRRYE